MAEEIRGTTGTVVRVRNHFRKNENEKEMFLHFDVTMLYLKDMMGISPKTEIFLSSRVNGREFFLADDASIKGYLLLKHFGDGLESSLLEIRYRRKRSKTMNEQGSDLPARFIYHSCKIHSHNI